MLQDIDAAEKPEHLTTGYRSICFRQASLADAHVLASLTIRSFRGAPFWDWIHAAPVKATPEQKGRIDAEVYRHRVSISKRQLCDPKLRAYIADYDGYPAAFSMWAVQPGTQNESLFSHRLRETSLYEKLLRVWYKIVDFFVSYIPDTWQTAIWYPTLGPLYLSRRKLIMRQQEASGSKLIAEEDKENGYRMLYFLGTLPEYERKGIGTLLLKEGLKEAEQDGVSVYLGATPSGRPLYERNGFTVISLEKKGESGVCTWEEAVMRWRHLEDV